MESSRRNFLKIAAALAIPGTPGMVKKARGSDGVAEPDARPAMLVDLTRCIGCRACVRACSEANHLPATAESEDINLTHRQNLSHQQWTAVNKETGKDSAGNEVTRNVKMQCMHCLEPACASVCPVAALHQSKEGPVVYRQERCIGCRYCMVACPFDIPKFRWDSGMKATIGKCQFCLKNRLLAGELPGCVSACPTGALKFGTRDRMMFEAKARVHARPDRYMDHIYGEKEAGGTSWLYLSDAPFESLGFKAHLPDRAFPALPRFVLSKLPSVAVTVLATVSGLSFILGRMQKKKMKDPQSAETKSGS